MFSVSLALAAASSKLPPPVNPLKPPMGFNTWNHFGMRPSETIFIDTANNLTKMGLADAGFTYINTDDGWLKRNRSNGWQNGSLLPMPEQFPNGMKALADTLHGMGFHFGV